MYRRATSSYRMPILVIELKWNKSAETALDQIRKKHYPEVLKGRNEQILLVGISYDKDDPEKKHSCIIEEQDGYSTLSPI